MSILCKFGSLGCPDGQSAIAAMAVVQLGFAINSLPSIADLGGETRIVIKNDSFVKKRGYPKP